MLKLVTGIASYMFHIPSKEINVFVTKQLQEKQYPLKCLEDNDIYV